MSCTPWSPAHRGVLHTVESCTPWSPAHRGVLHTVESKFLIFEIKHIGEIETEFENLLACLPGLESWKKWISKNSRHTPFNTFRLWLTVLVILYELDVLDLKNSLVSLRDFIMFAYCLLYSCYILINSTFYNEVKESRHRHYIFQRNFTV